MIATAEPSIEQICHEFRELLPELSSRLRCRFCEHGPDLRDEYTAEGIALSWQAYQSARRRGKTVTPSNLAWYTIKAVIAGRRLAGARSCDALSETRLARERIGTHVSLSDFEGDRQSMFYRTWGDRRSRWPVVDLVATKIDWGQFLATHCDPRDRRIVAMKLDGHPQIEIADELGISPSAICQRLRAVRQRWDARAVA